MLNLHDFRASRAIKTTDAAAAILGMEPSDFEVAIHVEIFNNGAAYMERLRDGRYHAPIGNDSRIGRWDQMSGWLYFEHYAREYVHDGVTLYQLAELLDDFADHIGLPHMCAREMQAELFDDSPTNSFWTNHDAYTWLEWFCQIWEDVQHQEDEAMRDPTYRAKMEHWRGAYIPGGMKLS